MTDGPSEFGAPREALEDRAAAFEAFANSYTARGGRRRPEDVQIDSTLLFAAYPFSSEFQPSRMPDFVFRECYSEAGDANDNGFEPIISIALDKEEGDRRYGFRNLDASLESGNVFRNEGGRGNFRISYHKEVLSHHAVSDNTQPSYIEIDVGGYAVIEDVHEHRGWRQGQFVASITLRQDETALPKCLVVTNNAVRTNIMSLLPSSIFKEGVNQVDALRDFLQDGSVERRGVEFSLLSGDRVRMLRIDPDDPVKKRVIFDIILPLGLTSEMAKKRIESLIGEGVLQDPIHHPAARNDRLVFIRTLETLGIKVETPGIEIVSDRALKDTMQEATSSDLRSQL